MKKYTVFFSFILITILVLSKPLYSDHHLEPIILRGDASFAPYEFSKDGKLSGASIELIKLIEKELHRPIIVKLGNWGEAQKLVKAGDGHGLTVLSINDERKKLYNFSLPTFTMKYSLFAKVENLSKIKIKELAGKKVGVKHGGFPETILKNKYPEIERVYVNNVLEGFKLVLEDKIDCVLEEEWTGYYTLREHNYSGIAATGDPLDTKQGYIGILKTHPEILAQLKVALEKVKQSEDFYHLLDRWSGQKVVIFNRAELETFYTIVIFFIVIIALIIISLLILFSLNKRRQNSELQKMNSELQNEIKQRIEAEKELTESEAKWRSLTENSPDHILLLDTEYGIKFINHPFQDLDKHELINQPFFKVINKPDIERVRTTLDGSVFDGRSCRFEFTFVINKTGQTYFETHARPIIQNNRVISLVLNVINITERKNHEIQLREAKELAEHANKSKGEFLANMSHEFRSPLNSIMVLSKMLSKSKNLKKKESDLAGIIHNSGNDLLSLVNDLLDLSKINDHKVELGKEKFELQTLCQQIEEIYYHIAKEKGLKFEINFGMEKDSYLYSDFKRLLQIIRNLLNNAFKFTKSGFINFKVYKTDVSEIKLADFKIDCLHLIAFQVIDSGIGIEKHHLSKIFERFTQADGSTTRTYGGTGLGLAISKQLSELFGGVITVDSEIDKGSTFTFYLPVFKE